MELPAVVSDPGNGKVPMSSQSQGEVLNQVRKGDGEVIVESSINL